MLLEDFVENVWRPLKTVRLRECTMAGYESALKCHILTHWGHMDMAR